MGVNEPPDISNKIRKDADTSNEREISACKSDIKDCMSNTTQEQRPESADEGRTLLDESSSASANTVEEVTKETSNQEASDLASIDTESNGARFHQSVL